MSDPAIDNALTKAFTDGGFGTISDTAFPNFEFEPTPGNDWAKIDLIPAKSTAASLGFSGKDLEQGVFQITLATEKGSGDGNILARAKNIKTYYQQNNRLIESGTEVNVTTITIEQGFISGDWYKVPVSIYYKAFLTRG